MQNASVHTLREKTDPLHNYCKHNYNTTMDIKSQSEYFLVQLYTDKIVWSDGIQPVKCPGAKV